VIPETLDVIPFFLVMAAGLREEEQRMVSRGY
jgi:hypothetical protein